MQTKPVLNPALKNFWATPARNRVLYGGRDSSKSWDAAGNAILLAQWGFERMICTRQFQNRIDDSVYTLLKIQIERFGLKNRFAIYNNRIECPENGSEFLFYGRARNIDDIKGTEGCTLGWHEECHLMTKAEWIIIDPTLRAEGSEHWLIFNPRFQKDFVYQNFVVKPPPDTVIRLINYDENPFLSSTSRKIIDHMRITDNELYAHIYGGQPLGDSEMVIIKRRWIEAAIDAHIKLGFGIDGPDKMGFDIADGDDVGGQHDSCANIHVKGSVALWSDEWRGKEDELLKSCSRTYRNAVAHNCHIFYDCIGVGAMAGAKFEEINQANSTKLRYSKFNAGGAVENPESYYSREGGKIMNKDFFCNLKAQTWWGVADRFRNTFDAITNGTQYKPDQLMSISSSMPQLEKLIDELSTPMRDFDQNGRVKVESKKDLAKRDVVSPNLADAYVMCFTPKKPGGFFGA